MEQKEKIKEIFLFEIQKKDDIINDSLKKIGTLILTIDQLEAIDLIIYCITICINKKKYKKLRYLYSLLEKFDLENFREFVSDLKRIFEKIFKNGLYSKILLKILSNYYPSWLYNFLNENKGFLNKEALNFLEDLKNEIKDFEKVKIEVDELIVSNIKRININYNNFDYFSFF